MILLSLPTPYQNGSPLVQPTVVFRSKIADEAESRLSDAERVQRLLAEGYRLLPCEELRVYAAPTLVASPAALAARRLSDLFEHRLGQGPIPTQDLDRAGRAAMAQVLGSNPFSGVIAKLPKGTPISVSADAGLALKMDVDGRTVRLDLVPALQQTNGGTKTLPEGLDLRVSVPPLVVEWIGPYATGKIFDGSLTVATKALIKAREAESTRADAMYRLIAQRALAPDGIKKEATRLDDLPPSLQEAILLEAERHFEMYGFKSAAEGREAINGGKIVSLRFTLDIAVAVPGNNYIFGLERVGY